MAGERARIRTRAVKRRTLLAAALAPLAGRLEAAGAAPPRDPDADAGWIDISPGPRLEGWTEYPWFDQAGDAWRRAGQWHMDTLTGVLRCDGAPDAHTMFLHERALGDFLLHVEWRFTGAAEPGRYNSGVLLRMLPETAERKVMHQIETGATQTHAGWLRGGSLDAGVVCVLDSELLTPAGWRRVNPGYPKGWQRHVTSVDPASNPQGLSSAYDVAIQAPVRPPGEWNRYDVECVGSRIAVWTNGVASCRAGNCRIPRGRVGLEAEWHEIEFRRLRVKPL